MMTNFNFLIFGIFLASGQVSTLDQACDATQCPGYVFSAKAFFGDMALFCWSFDDTILYACESSSATWIPYKNQYAPDVPCHGNFQVSILGSNFRLAGTTWNRKITAEWYLARLRRNEGEGWFYCSVPLVSNGETRVFYYNGTYWDVRTDNNGQIFRVPQKQPQHELIQFAATKDVSGCEHSSCCWLQDYHYSREWLDGTGNLTIREFLWFENSFFIWDNETFSYEFYSGLGNVGMAKCLRFASRMQWTSAETTYLAINGSVFVVTTNATGFATYDAPPAGTPDGHYLSLATTNTSANGSVYFNVEGSVFYYSVSTGLKYVTFANGSIVYETVPAAPVDANWTEASYSNKSNPLPLNCRRRSCSGVAFYSPNSTALLCQSNPEDFLSFCDPSTGVFLPYVSKTVPAKLCSGQSFTFQIGRNQFMLNRTEVFKVSRSNWILATTNPFDYEWYFSRMRPGEGSGKLFCQSYHFNGASFFDAQTSVIGYIDKVPKAVSQYARSYFYVNQEEDGCRNPACCWFTDVYLPSRGSPYQSEYYFDGEKYWVWVSGVYVTHSGDVPPNMARCMAYASNMRWSHVNGRNVTRYRYLNGSMFQEPVSNLSKPVNQTFTEDFNPSNDALAVGGIYGYLEPTSNVTLHGTGTYQNVTGLWWVQFRFGVMLYRKMAPSCQRVLPRSKPACNFTRDLMTLTRSDRTPCNPYMGGNTCGANYQCVDIAKWWMLPQKRPACTLGVCVPDFEFFCPAPTTPAPPVTTTSRIVSTTSVTTTTEASTTTGPTTTAPTTTAATTTPAPMGTPQRYGARCNYDSDCLTGICSGNKCSCSDCTKILPFVDYSWRLGKYIYGERCIPSNSSIGGLGDTCDMWADVPQSYCGFGLTCNKCPETWNTRRAPAICIAYNFTSTLPTEYACPNWFKCGYQATCSMINDDTPVCLCPPGYNLEENGQDCYGWNVTRVESCDVTCGNGKAAILRYCDRASGSKAFCDGQKKIYERCSPTNAPCPIDSKVATKAVQIKLRSNVLDVELFEKFVESDLKVSLASSLLQRCLSEKSTFEKACCLGKEFPKDKWLNRTGDMNCVSAGGVNFYSKFTTGEEFSFYLTLKGDSESSCCKRANWKPTKKRRKKRQAQDDGMLDQSTLASLIIQQDFVDAITLAARQVDPNILPAFTIYLPTTTTTTTSRYDPGVGATANQGLQMWVIYLGVGIVVFVVVTGIVIAVCIVAKKKAARDAKLTSAHRPGETNVNGQVYVPNNHLRRQYATKAPKKPAAGVSRAHVLEPKMMREQQAEPAANQMTTRSAVVTPMQRQQYDDYLNGGNTY